MGEVIPAAKDLITIDGKEIPIMADVDESGLVALLKTVAPPHDLKVREIPASNFFCGPGEMT